MRKVFAVGAMQIDEAPNSKRNIVSDRLWSLYLKFEDAEKAVLENRGDLFEYTYNYALIEEIRVLDPSTPPSKEERDDWFPPKEYWYKATYRRHDEVRTIGQDDPIHDPIVVKVDKPACLDKIVYFWVG